MSGSSDVIDCPRCGGNDTLHVTSDWRPHDMSCGTCVQCGYQFWTEFGIADKDTLEEEQQSYEFTPVEVTEEMRKRTAQYDHDNYITGRPDYKGAYGILMEYWDSISDEEKPEVDKRLKEVGL